MGLTQRITFLKHEYMVMNNNMYRKKLNILYLIGIHNSGKSLISNSLAIYSFHTGECGKNSSGFQFEDMLFCRTAHLDEPQIDPGKTWKYLRCRNCV